MAAPDVRHALDRHVDRAISRPAYTAGYLAADAAIAVLFWALGRRLTRR